MNSTIELVGETDAVLKEIAHSAQMAAEKINNLASIDKVQSAMGSVAATTEET